MNIDSVDCENSSITNNKNFPSLHEFNCNVNLQDKECIENSFNESENTYHIEHNSNFDNNQEIGNYFDNLEYSNLNENLSLKEPEQNITLNNNELLEDLRTWIVEFDIDKAAINANVALWRKYGYNILADYRIIMKTPRLAAEHIHKIGDCFYSHFGIVYKIKPRIKNVFHTFPKKIKMFIFMVFL